MLIKRPKVEVLAPEQTGMREPLFGSGAGLFFAELLTAAGGLVLLALVVMFAGGVTHNVKDAMFGAPAHHQSLAPGNYDWSPERGLTKSN